MSDHQPSEIMQNMLEQAKAIRDVDGMSEEQFEEIKQICEEPDNSPLIDDGDNILEHEKVNAMNDAEIMDYLTSLRPKDWDMIAKAPAEAFGSLPFDDEEYNDRLIIVFRLLEQIEKGNLEVVRTGNYGKEQRERLFDGE